MTDLATATLPDADRIRAELEHITAHPQAWEQGAWVIQRPGCGTAACLAGGTVLHEGLEVAWAVLEDPDSPDYGVLVARELTNGRYIRDAARVLLGLTPLEADVLFHSANDLHALWCLASEITVGEIVIDGEVSHEHTPACRRGRARLAGHPIPMQPMQTDHYAVGLFQMMPTACA